MADRCPYCGITPELKRTETIFGNLYAITIYKCGLEKRSAVRWRENSCEMNYLGVCGFSQQSPS